jgi:hypothetical protein
MPISDLELHALRNLADKQSGEAVEWISIAAARALTELGLARRTRSGWEITAEGLALIQDQAAVEPDISTTEPTPLHPGPVIATD